MSENNWKPIATAPEGVAVLTLSAGGQEQVLTRSGRLWFAGDMYVYYTPTHWKEVSRGN